MQKTLFIILVHRRPSTHHDIRIKYPPFHPKEKRKLWLSFATRKLYLVLPEKSNQKIMLFQTPDHSEEQALLRSPERNEYTKWDYGICRILSWQDDLKISLVFEGSKIKGLFHLIKVPGYYKSSSWLFFRGKEEV